MKHTTPPISSHPTRWAGHARHKSLAPGSTGGPSISKKLQTTDDRRQTNSAFVLITVLLIVVLLESILLTFNHRAVAAAQNVRNYLDDQQIQNAARSTLQAAINTLNNRPQFKKYISPKTQNPNLSPLCSIQITEENGKFNLNTLVNPDGSPNRPAIDRFLRLLDRFNQQIPPQHHAASALAPAIIDWIDPDDRITWLDFIFPDGTGAESKHYLHQDPPTPCPNKPLQTIEELLHIKHITPALFHGPTPSPTPSVPHNIGLKHLLTIYGDGRIDINTAPLLVLQALDDNLTPHIAQAILNHRDQTPFESVEELLAVPQVAPALYQKIKTALTTDPPLRFYRVIANAKQPSRVTTVTAVLEQNKHTDSTRIIWYNETTTHPDESQEY